MNRYRMFYIQTSTSPPRMHHKLTKHGKFCKQNNQLPTKTHVELKDNSIEPVNPTVFNGHPLTQDEVKCLPFERWALEIRPT
jgi:hypothetical protein